MGKLFSFRNMLILTILWMVLMRFFTPSNIVQFELAKTTQIANDIIQQWGSEGMAKARLSIYLDFVFLIFYAASIYLALSYIIERISLVLLKQGCLLLSRLIWVAALLDLLENILMLVTLDHISEIVVYLTYLFAAIKFGIVLIALLILLISFIVHLITSTTKSE